MKYIIGGIVGLIALVFVFSWYNAAKNGNIMENVIEAQYLQNQNSLSTMSNTIAEAAQVPTMAKDDLKEVIKAGIEGRYGANGSTAMFQAMKEAYPGTLDPKLYENLQTLIEAKRNDFANEQKTLVDKVRVYKTAIGSPFGRFFYNLAGYPSAEFDFNKYKPITSDYANDSFKTGIDKGLKLR